MRGKNMNDIQQRAEKIYDVFNKTIPPICLKADGERYGVLSFAPAGSDKYLALYDRGDHALYHDAVAAPNKPIALYSNFREVAADGWRVD